MNRYQHQRLASQAQGYALRQVCRENQQEYRRIYQELLNSGYRANNVKGCGPKAQPRAQIEMSKRHPDRYRALYLHYKDELTAQIGRTNAG